MAKYSEQQRIQKMMESIVGNLLVMQIEDVIYGLLFAEWNMTEKSSNTKKQRTQQAVEQAAYELFMEKGFTATSMRQIAERSGLSLGGIYNHYESKEEIFRAIILARHPYKQILPLVLEAKGKSPEEFLRSAARAAVSELGQSPEFLKLMFIEIVEFNGEHLALILQEIFPKVLPVFEEYASHRKFLQQIGPVLMIRSFIAMVFSYYLTEMLIQGSTLTKLMPENSFDVFVDIYLHGILKEIK